MAEYEEDDIPPVLLPCATCSRTFKPEALAKHIKYCEKTLIKKRRVFDSAKQRIQGTDLAEFIPVITSNRKKIEKSPLRKTQSKWKEKHMELVRAIRAARVSSTPNQPQAPPVKPVDHERCPHCDRYFGPKAFDRHLEWCKEQSTRIQPKSPASIQAKERLEARTKYRAPILMKSRRTMTREKYQPPGKIRDPSPIDSNNHKPPSNRMREPSPMERPIRTTLTTVPPKQKTSSHKADVTAQVDHLSRNQSLRNSRRNYSPMKKVPIQPKSKNAEPNYSPQQKERQKTDSSVYDNTPQPKSDDIFNASCNITSIRPKENTIKPKMKTRTQMPPIFQPGNNHNNVPLPAEACEQRPVAKRRFVRKQPLLNDIHVNDDIAGMTVCPCYSSGPTNSKKHWSNDEQKEKIPSSINDSESVKSDTSLNSTYAKTIDFSETKSVKALSEETFAGISTDVLLDCNSSVHRFNEFIRGSKADSVLPSKPPPPKSNEENGNQINKSGSVLCRFKVKSPCIPDEETEKKENCLANDVQAGTDACTINGIRMMKKLNLPKELMTELINELALSDKLLNTPVFAMNGSDSFIEDDKSKDRHFQIVPDKINSHENETNHVNMRSVQSDAVAVCSNYRTNTGNKRRERDLPCNVNCVSNKISDDDLFRPISQKRRRINTLDSMEFLYVTSPLKYDESSACNVYDMSGKNINTGQGCSSSTESVDEDKDKETDEFCSSCGLLNMDTELCKDCQRSKSDSDLYFYYNKNLSKCCLLRQNKMFTLKKTFEKLFNESVGMASVVESVVTVHNSKHDETVQETFAESVKSTFSDDETHSNKSKYPRSLRFIVHEPVVANFVIQNDSIYDDNVQKSNKNVKDKEESSVLLNSVAFNTFDNHDITCNKMTLSDLDTAFVFRDEDIFPYKNDALVDINLVRAVNHPCSHRTDTLAKISTSSSSERIDQTFSNNDTIKENPSIARELNTSELNCEFVGVPDEKSQGTADCMIKEISSAHDAGELHCDCIRKVDEKSQVTADCMIKEISSVHNASELYCDRIKKVDENSQGTADCMIKENSSVHDAGELHCDRMSKVDQNSQGTADCMIKENSSVHDAGELHCDRIRNVDVIPQGTADCMIKENASIHDASELHCDRIGKIDLKSQVTAECTVKENFSIHHANELNCDIVGVVNEMSRDLADNIELNSNNDGIPSSLKSDENMYVPDFDEISENNDDEETDIPDFNSEIAYDLRMSNNSNISKEIIEHIINYSVDDDSLESEYEEEVDFNAGDADAHSESNVNNIEHYEYTETMEECYMSYRTEINCVESCSWNSHQLRDGGKRCFPYEEDSLERCSVLPPIETNTNSVLPSLTSSQGRGLGRKVPQMRSRKDKLTTWQQQARRLFPPINDKIHVPGRHKENQYQVVKLPSIHMRNELPVHSNNKKDVKVVCSLHNYDPYKSAERQMKELLGLDDGEGGQIYHQQEKTLQPTSVPQTNIISSPTSAFAKFTPIHPADPPSDCENNFIPPPSSFNDIGQEILTGHERSEIPINDNNCVKSSGSERTEIPVMNDNDCVKDRNENTISLSSLSLCSTISIDSIDYSKNSFRKSFSNSAKTQSCDKKIVLPLKRSISAVEPQRRGRALLKGNLKMEHLLYGFSSDNNERLSGTHINDVQIDDSLSFESLSLSNESLKRTDSTEETTTAEQELLKSMFEFEKLFESPSLKPISPLVPSTTPAPLSQSPGSIINSEGNKLQTHSPKLVNKFNTDSAYNSLNRRSPQLGGDASVDNADVHVGSSSGSECSLPPLVVHNTQAAKFCHECGAKYPIVLAKFCCQCGVRRLVI